MESYKVTAKDIQQVAGDLPVAQIQLMQHQCTELLAGNYPRRKQTSTTRQNHKITSPWKFPQSRNPLTFWKPDTHSNKCTRCGDTLHAKGFQCPVRKSQCKVCHKFGHFTTVCYQKSQQPSHLFKMRKSKAQQL